MAVKRRAVRNQRKNEYIVEENKYGRFDVKRGRDDYAAWNLKTREQAEDYANLLNTAPRKKP